MKARVSKAARQILDDPKARVALVDFVITRPQKRKRTATATTTIKVDKTKFVVSSGSAVKVK